jgi:hypothetical protein
MSKPKQYADCAPYQHCPWVSCRYNLQSEVVWRGKRVNENMQDSPTHTCALRAAGEGPRSLQEVAELLGTSHEYARQGLNSALRKLALSEEFAAEHGE